MWTIETLIAADENDNFVTITGKKLNFAVTVDKLKICRSIELDETPPCLSIAVDDLIKLVTRSACTSPLQTV